MTIYHVMFDNSGEILMKAAQGQWQHLPKSEVKASLLPFLSKQYCAGGKSVEVREWGESETYLLVSRK